VLVPLAVIHASRLVGFLAVLAIYGALGFVFLAFGMGFLIGFNGANALHRCVVASVILMVGLTALRVSGLDPSYVRPFALGGMCLGNIMYFLAVLILSSKWHGDRDTYVLRQAAMLVSLIAAILLGSVYAIPAMTNTACTFLVLWLMEKELEVDWASCTVVVAFFNFVALFLASLWLHQHPQYILSMFDSSGMYT